MNHHNWTQTFDNVTPSSSSLHAATMSNFTNGTSQMSINKTTAITYPIVFIVGFLGNTFAIYVVARYSKLNTVTNIYIINLAIADELYVLGIPFILTNNIFSYWPFGDFFCKMFMTTDAMCQFASTFCLTLMSIDRFLAVVFPMRSAKWRTPPKAKIFSGIVWLLSFLTVLPVTIYSHVQEDFNTCNLSWPEPLGTWSMVFILYTSILGFFCPLIVISLCYLLIVIKVKSASVRAGLTKRRRSERKVTRMVVIIVFVFVLCWLPFFTANIVNLFYVIPENETTAAIYFTLVILTYVNSCANPFLYGFLSENFEKNMKKALQCGKRNNPTSPKSGRQSTAKGVCLELFQQSVQMKVCRNSDRQPITSKPAMNGQ
ncbi:Somatostatin receptor type 5 [Oryzias melastigma]|uniref:Somatostatin receptor type 5 n=1 Tax=Oryzias melastigma TaxID=30732 RepID=A0A834KX38_ORYME|nr:Somatostatin receptor type 5 [Oryzias melastigma]